MSTRDLINAIAAGDAIEIENAFNSVMAEKVSERIDDMRVTVAQNMFEEHQKLNSTKHKVGGVTYSVQSHIKPGNNTSIGSFHHVGTVNGKKFKLRSAENGHSWDGQHAKHLTDDEKTAVKKHIKQNNYGLEEELESQYDELTLEDYSLEEIEEFMQTEDFEQLDELNKNTLTSYVDKSKQDIEHKKKQADDFDKRPIFTVKDMNDYRKQKNTEINRRRQGIERATNRLK